MDFCEGWDLYIYALDTEETHDTHNLYVESTRGNLKNIIKYLYGESILAKHFQQTQVFPNQLIPKFLQLKELTNSKTFFIKPVSSSSKNASISLSYE